MVTILSRPQCVKGIALYYEKYASYVYLRTFFYWWTITSYWWCVPQSTLAAGQWPGTARSQGIRRQGIDLVLAEYIAICGTHYNDVIMGSMASQITSLTIVYSAVYSGADQRKHQSSSSLAFVRGIQRGPANSSHKWPVTRTFLSIWWRHHEKG